MPAPPLNSSQEATVQALNEIRLDISLGKNRSASKESHLRELYKPKRSKQPIYFYVQDGNGFPIHRISNSLDRGQGTVYPSLELDITFDPTDWPNTLPRPPNYDGSWPPISREDLLGDVTQDPLCVYGCRSICRHRYDPWLKKQPTSWTNRLAIRDTGNTGYGLYARQDLFSGTILGPYSGAFIPDDASNESDYLTNIWIGLWSEGNFSEGTIDALHAGSPMRFINSSCTPNAILEHRTVGMDLRIVIVKLIKNVKAGEQIFLSYGVKYFTNGRYCRCGEKRCKFSKLEAGDSGRSSTEGDNIEASRRLDMDGDAKGHKKAGRKKVKYTA
jgi:hypothetical protein